MRKIPLKADVYTKLENTAKIKGLTPDELASKIILEKSTCHNCGLESADDCPKRHIPYDFNVKPCRNCLRNPQIILGPQMGNLKPKQKDFWNECLTLDENNLPFIER